MVDVNLRSKTIDIIGVEVEFNFGYGAPPYAPVGPAIGGHPVEQLLEFIQNSCAS
jgi:hypothetical protein